jgi:hypothetical protein
LFDELNRLRQDGHDNAKQLKAWQDCGEVVAKAAGVLGVSPSTVRDHIGAVKNYAASQRGYSR